MSGPWGEGPLPQDVERYFEQLRRRPLRHRRLRRLVRLVRRVRQMLPPALR